MKSKLTLFLFILFISCIYTFGQNKQNNGLILRGVYTDWSGGGVNESENIIRWGIKLRMELINEGDDPVILIYPNRGYNIWQNKAYFSGKLLSDSGELEDFDFSKELWIDNDHYTQAYLRSRKSLLESLAITLDDEKPPQNAAWILNPGESISFDDELSLKQKYDKKKIDGKEVKVLEGPASELNLRKDERGIPFSHYTNIRIQYKISFLKTVEDPDFMEKLQGKWLKFGHFPVDADGNFSITSEVLTRQ